nr:MAG TPA: hypothetical protein [Crassvirales sp.]
MILQVLLSVVIRLMVRNQAELLILIIKIIKL